MWLFTREQGHLTLHGNKRKCIILFVILLLQEVKMLRKVFYISDGTAITAEVFGHAVLSQFPLEFDALTIPFVETKS